MVLIFFMVLLGLATLLTARLAKITQQEALAINAAHPACGEIIQVDGQDIHFVDTGTINNEEKSLPTVVFLHGASSNLRDPLHVFKKPLMHKARLIFIDRPGLGWSSRTALTCDPLGQARQIMGLLDKLSVSNVVLVGHSWSGALIAAIALAYPQRVAGLLFNAPVSHPWPHGVNWYYYLAAHKWLGPVFCNTLTLPIGLRQLDCATKKVFWPNPVPESYGSEIGNKMVLTPGRFRANAQDIVRLSDFVSAQSEHYHMINAPTTIITGDKDQIVFPWLHSKSLKRDIAHAKHICLKNTGHMPHHSASDVFITEIEALIDAAKIIKKGVAA